MTNFWDLPKTVRNEIYRLDLVRDEPITLAKHRLIATHASGGRFFSRRLMPPLLAISKKADREAAPIYYGDNHFDVAAVNQAWSLSEITYPRHFRMIRKITCWWTSTDAREGFLAIARMKGLQELNIRVNEGDMVRQASYARHNRQIWNIHDEELTQQQQLVLLRWPGMSALMTISNVPVVQFVKTKSHDGRDVGGAIPGGFLETQVLPKLTGIRPVSVKKIGLEDDTFPFLSLPPEIRNRIYSILLRIDGKLHPSTRQPSSTAKKSPSRACILPTPESALSLLAVNKQVNDEAFGIFYHCNAFEFYYPTQLHAFMLSIGEERQKFIQDLTLHYYNYKVGGIDIAELTFPMLKQLSGLRRLQIVLDMGTHKLIRSNYYWSINGSGWNITKANPLQLPGMKVLFTLRGVTDIELRCRDLDKDFEEAQKDKEFPNFSEKSHKACVTKLVKVFKHFNQALADAQQGRVNKKMLNDPEWHLKDVFPTIDEDAVKQT